jgi:hypothetical protein
MVIKTDDICDREEPIDNTSSIMDDVDTSTIENTGKDETAYIQSNTIEQPSIECKEMEYSDPISFSSDLKEIELSLDEIPETEQIQIKNRNDVYYKLYQYAKKKAKMARDLALSSYLEAKRIKNSYLLNDTDSESDLDEESFENIGESE